MIESEGSVHIVSTVLDLEEFKRLMSPNFVLVYPYEFSTMYNHVSLLDLTQQSPC